MRAVSEQAEKKLEIAEIALDRYNPLLERREVVIVVNHIGDGTPSRATLRKLFAEHLNADPSLIFIRRIKTEFGMNKSICEVHVYKNAEAATKLEPKHIIERHKEKKEEEEQ